MARNDDTLWDTLGRTAQAVRAFLPEGGIATSGHGGRGGRAGREARTGGEGGGLLADPTARVLTGALAAVVTAGIVKWAKTHRPSARRLARGAVAGAAAAGIVLVGKVILDSRRDDGSRRRDEPGANGSGVDRSGRAPSGEGAMAGLPDVMAELLAGAGRGILYAAFLDPLLPGPPLVKGAIVGSAEHLASPLGGLYAALEPVSPLRKVPLVSALLRVGGGTDRPFVAHLANGVLLGLLCGTAERVTHGAEEES